MLGARCQLDNREPLREDLSLATVHLDLSKIDVGRAVDELDIVNLKCVRITDIAD